MDFSNKVVLVTGGSRGIGAATVRKIVSSGGSVVIHYRSNQAAAERLVAELGNDNCHLVKQDLATPGAASGLWSDALAWKGKIDAVVNNAGIFLEEDREGSDEKWRELWLQTLQVNLISAADLCREAINHWLSTQTSGSIVNVASRAAFRGDDPDHWAYAASKGALVSLTKTLTTDSSATVQIMKNILRDVDFTTACDLIFTKIVKFLRNGALRGSEAGKFE